ncbi:MAG: DUF2236 domain-containing protein [Alphaproteobacteria bacterium]|nr:DUF2236 domain-containing protein [Alphaproteobacteria bacterium]
MGRLHPRLPLPPLVQEWAEAAAEGLFQPQGEIPFDFASPPGEEALVPACSLSWRIFKNPVALFIGGVAAVILELAEPAVRTGVWEHSSFRDDPVRRLQRTGRAAMITVYGARSRAEAMIAGVVRLHERIHGTTPSGEPFRADDPALLAWVQATASYGFAQATHRYVRPLDGRARDVFCREGLAAARLYGAASAPASETERRALFDSMRTRLEPSPIIFDFLSIMREAQAFPGPLAGLQRLLLRAAIEITPAWVRRRLGLTKSFGLRSWETPIVRQAAGLAGSILLRSSPAVRSCLRLGLPADYLYRD